jgi:hypothetical protein
LAGKINNQPVEMVKKIMRAHFKKAEKKLGASLAEKKEIRKTIEVIRKAASEDEKIWETEPMAFDAARANKTAVTVRWVNRDVARSPISPKCDVAGMARTTKKHPSIK